MTVPVKAPRQVDPVVEAFAREAAAAGVHVHGPMAPEEVLAVVEQLVRETGTSTILSWQPEALGLPDAWRALEARGLIPISPRLPPEAAPRLSALAALDGVAVGLTSAVGALADTGTIALESGPDRPRLAWLLPSRHIAIVDTSAVSADMDAFFQSHPRFATSAGPRTDPAALPAHLAFVTGPSRTADIELTLTRGVHGPREVHVILMAR